MSKLLSLIIAAAFASVNVAAVAADAPKKDVKVAAKADEKKHDKKATPAAAKKAAPAAGKKAAKEGEKTK